MVATANPLATLAGVRMLAQGGNAVDAVVASAAAIGVVEPYMSGLAGCGTLVLTPAGGIPRALIFLGRAPASATPDRFNGKRPDGGWLAPAVPGNLAGWARVLADYGTLSLAKVLEPAIELAERGVPFTPFDQQMFLESGQRLTREGTATYYHDGRVPVTGSLMVQPDLAATLRHIAKEGIGYLYGGTLGREIGRLMKERGGLISEDDLRSYPDTLRWVDPLQTSYRRVTVYAPPPPTSAVQTLETLNILETFDVAKWGHLTPDHLALVAEACRAARMDTERFIGDPAFREVPTDRLLSAEHTRELRAEVDRHLGAASAVAGTPGGAGDGGGGIASTTHLAAADASGLAVNITHSLGSGFGSGVVVPGTGVCLNNAMHWFSVTPNHANVVAPGKTHEWPIAPLHLHKDGRFWGTIGTPGSYGILVTTAQVLVHLIDFGLNLQDAIAAPRFRWVDDVGDALPARVLRIESRIPEATCAALAGRGYEIDMLGPWSMRVGGVQGILMDQQTGWLSGGADPRRNGYAIGW
jgi:gamma-glutamyltranspeptidase/glutathione hydrolase